MKTVDSAIGSVLDALDASGMAENTIVVFTSDHGELLGAHGGLQQKWYNAYEEALHVPFVVRGPGIDGHAEGVRVPTSHVDLVPTLLGLAGADPSSLLDVVAAHHTEAQPLPGRNLADVVRSPESQADSDQPIYFMTEDQFSQGPQSTNPMTGASFTPVTGASNVEAVVVALPTGPGGARELWKLARYYGTPGSKDAALTASETYNLTTDPQERHNLAADSLAPVSELHAVLAEQRAAKRATPRFANATKHDAARALGDAMSSGQSA
jgi:arylsulfatase A-like enzyme